MSLEHHLGEIANTAEKFQSSNESVSHLDKQSEVLKEALSIPNHPLISMQDRSVLKWVAIKPYFFWGGGEEVLRNMPE